jgi:hypothetical protein
MWILMMSSRDMNAVEYPDADAWVGANFFLYYKEGNPKARVSPDVLLARGMDRRDRRNYLLWEEKIPSLIVEVTSRKTRRKDTGLKKEVYERIGVEEYILFDPLGEYLRPQLQGYRLVRGRYQSAHPLGGGWHAAEPDHGPADEIRRPAVAADRRRHGGAASVEETRAARREAEPERRLRRRGLGPWKRSLSRFGGRRAESWPKRMPNGARTG